MRLQDLAVAMRRHPAQVTRWLKGPGNWTIDTISDILRVLRAELELAVVFYEEKIPPNYQHDLVSETDPEQQTPLIEIKSSVRVTRVRITPQQTTLQPLKPREVGSNPGNLNV
jgi:hypothetical protein